MKVVFLKKNNFLEYNISGLQGYTFNPRGKNIDYLNVVDEDFIKYILSKKIKREINKVRRAIDLMIKSDVNRKIIVVLQYIFETAFFQNQVSVYYWGQGVFYFSI
mgnify:CR=1 FL=1